MADEELENSENQDELLDDMSDLDTGSTEPASIDTSGLENKVESVTKAMNKQAEELTASVKSVKKMVVILGTTTLVLLLGAVGGGIFMTMGNGQQIHSINENVTLVQQDLKSVIIASEDARQASLIFRKNLTEKWVRSKRCHLR